MKVDVTRGSENAQATRYCEYSEDPLQKVTSLPVTYDLLGSIVTKWIIEQEQPGYKRIVWDSRDKNGQLVPAGIYIYQLSARSVESDMRFNSSLKMVLIK